MANGPQACQRLPPATKFGAAEQAQGGKPDAERDCHVRFLAL